MNLSVLIPWNPDTSDTYRILALGWLLRRYEQLLPDAQVCLGLNKSEPFARSRARNDAFEQSTGDLLLIADADTLFDPRQIGEAMDLAASGDCWVLPYGSYYNLDQSTSRDIVLADPSTSTTKLGLPPEEYEHKIEDSPAGLLVMKREHFETVNGYDERFIGWGYEDSAFRHALNVLVGQARRLPEFDCYHLWHRRSEAENFGSPTIGHNRGLFRDYERARTPEEMREVLS